MKKLLFWLIGLPLAIVAAVFAVSNRTVVDISLWPTPFSVELPLYLVTLGALAIGLLVGALFTWLGQAKLRVRLRDRDLQIRDLKRDLDRKGAENEKLATEVEAQKALPPAA